MQIDKMQNKTASRLIAFQVIYQMHFFDFCNDFNSILVKTLNCYKKNYIQESLEQTLKIKPSIKFCLNLIHAFLINKAKVNNYTLEIFKDCKYEICINILSIFNAAITEMIYFDTNSKIIVSEFTNIAASSIQSYKINFINALLDKASKKTDS